MTTNDRALMRHTETGECTSSCRKFGCPNDEAPELVTDHEPDEDRDVLDIVRDAEETEMNDGN